MSLMKLEQLNAQEQYDAIYELEQTMKSMRVANTLWESEVKQQIFDLK